MVDRLCELLPLVVLAPAAVEDDGVTVEVDGPGSVSVFVCVEEGGVMITVDPVFDVSPVVDAEE